MLIWPCSCVKFGHFFTSATFQFSVLNDYTTTTTTTIALSAAAAAAAATYLLL